MSVHLLEGCRPEPLGSYLKALGVLRLVGSQADRTAAGWWDGDAFVLQTELDFPGLLSFFLDRYVPTPIVSPWNSSSGFGREGVGELGAIESSSEERLAPYRQAIAASRLLLDRQDSLGWDKATMVAACRNAFPDEALGWLDAAVVLTGEGTDLAFPPLLGTGGNDGRLEFSRNFHRRIIDVLGLAARRPADRSTRESWLEDSLLGSATAPILRGESPGQFDPGSAGGVNSSPLGRAESVLNPWDYVLFLEGSILFASGLSRRLAVGARGKAAMPFMVNASPVGYASAADEKARGEIWLPLWHDPVGLDEIARLFAEGRAEWGGRRASSGLEVAKAAASLGVDRGLGSFSRHVFVERFGLSTVAVPAGRTPVTPRREIAPLEQLDRWVEQVRRAGEAPASVSASLRALDESCFELAREGGTARVIAVLMAAARLEFSVARSGSFRARANRSLVPIWTMKAADWVPAILADGSSPELRLAIALSSCRDVSATGRATATLRLLLKPIEVHEGRLRFTDRAVVPGLGSRPLPEVLASAHVRRVYEAEATAHERSDETIIGVQTRYLLSRTAPLADVAALARGLLDESLLSNMLGGLLCLDWSSGWSGTLNTEDRLTHEPALSVLGPFFARRDRDLPELVPEASWPSGLAHGRTELVLAAALRRLRIAGLRVAPLSAAVVASTAPSGPRLGAALLCPLSSASAKVLIDAVATPESEDTTTEEVSVHAQP